MKYDDVKIGQYYAADAHKLEVCWNRKHEVEMAEAIASGTYRISFLGGICLSASSLFTDCDNFFSNHVKVVVTEKGLPRLRKMDGIKITLPVEQDGDLIIGAHILTDIWDGFVFDTELLRLTMTLRRQDKMLKSGNWTITTDGKHMVRVADGLTMKYTPDFW